MRKCACSLSIYEHEPLDRNIRGFAFCVGDPLSCIHTFTLMIKQVGSWCVTVGSGPGVMTEKE
jgi:hypothetical protein